MFRAMSCSSSGDQIVLILHLVSSLSVSDRLVHIYHTGLLTACEQKHLLLFRATSCSSSGGKIVLIQHLVSSLSVSDRLVHRLRENFSAVLSQPVHRTVTYRD